MPHTRARARAQAPESTSSTSSSSTSVVLDAFTFDGTPFRVTIPSMTTVGCGATAKIFVGHIIHRDRPLLVAVKVFGNMLEDHHQELLRRELRTARQVSVGRHPLILPFIGSASFGMQTAIVSHYMRNGNLLEYFKSQQGVGECVDKAKLIIQVAEAINHLHTVERLVHGDLKCANVLVSELGDALLADFGLSTFVEKAQTSATTAMSVRGMYTVHFAAPEILRDVAGEPARVRSKTRESDVYAFGMLILEAITERPPWSGFNDFAVMHHVCRGFRPARPETGFCQAWWDICRSCWRVEPEKRPAIRIVLKKLARNQHNIDDSPVSESATWATWTSHPRLQPMPGAFPETHIAEAPARIQRNEQQEPNTPLKGVPLARRADTPAPRPRPAKSATIVTTAHAPQPRRTRSQVLPAAAHFPQPPPARQSPGENAGPHTGRSAPPRAEIAGPAGSGSTTWPPVASPADAGETSWTTWEPHPRYRPSPPAKDHHLPKIDAPGAHTQSDPSLGRTASFANERTTLPPKHARESSQSSTSATPAPGPGLFGPREMPARRQ